MFSHASGAGMGTMGTAKGVVDVDIAQLCQCGSHGRVILFFALVKTGIFEHQHLTGLQCGNRSFGFGTNCLCTK